MNRLFIATPIYSGGTTEFWMSMMQAWPKLSAAGIMGLFKPLDGDSAVQRARNVLLAEFMRTEADAIFFVDSDLKWDAEDLIRLYRSGKDICCGVYPKKTLPTAWPANLWRDGEGMGSREESGMVRMQDAPNGFLLIRRHVVERMIEAYPETRCQFGEEEDSWGHALFEMGIEPDTRRYLSEDYWFCRKAQQLGFEVWADPAIRLGHRGPWTFNGCYGEALAENGIEGWMSPAELWWLQQTAGQMGSVVEVGCWKGRSTHTLAKACKGIVFAVDTWQGSPEDLVGPDAPHAEAVTGDIFGQFLQNVADCPNVKPIRGESVKVAEEPQYIGTIPVESGGSVGCFAPIYADMVFIDASHLYEAVKADIAAWLPKAKKIICGHDLDRPDVQRAVAEAFGDRVTNPVGSIWAVELEAQT